MRLLQITPGAGGMYCGNCFRDNALVTQLRQLGHETLMVPLYLPMTVDEEDQSRGTPVFFGGVNVYLDQKLPWYRHTPAWFRRWLDHPAVLRWAAGRTASTRAREVGDMTLSMLRGEDGHQRRDLEELVHWLQGQPKFDGVCLSNALLLGLARGLRRGLGTRVICMLQGEDAFVDSMPEPYRGAVWRALQERAADVDAFAAPSRYFADRMMARLQLDPARLHVVPNGINVHGYAGPRPASAPTAPRPAVIGFFARMCREKGLDTLVHAFIRLRQRNQASQPRLQVGGSLGPADEPFVNGLKQDLAQAGLQADVEWTANPDRAGKINFLHGLDVFSVPARSGEAYGLYLLESMAAGVPVVQPRTAAFPEIVDATGGGVLFEPENVDALADTLESLLLDPARLRALGAAGRSAVFSQHTSRHMAERMLTVFQAVLDSPGCARDSAQRPALSSGASNRPPLTTAGSHS